MQGSALRAYSVQKQYDEQIIVLSRRVKLLANQNDKCQQAIKNKKKFMEKQFEIQNFKNINNEMLLKNDEIQKRQIQILTDKAQTSRNNQHQILNEVKERQYIQKRMDNLQIQEIKKINNQEIINMKNDIFLKKKSKYNQMKQQQLSQNENIQGYWESRYQQFSQDRSQQYYQSQTQQQEKQNLIKGMLQLESLQIEKLQKSQQSFQNFENQVKSKSISFKQQFQPKQFECNSQISLKFQ